MSGLVESLRSELSRLVKKGSRRGTESSSEGEATLRVAKEQHYESRDVSGSMEAKTRRVSLSEATLCLLMDRFAPS